MRPKKRSSNWPDAYEAPRVYHIDTAFQQALGVTMCSSGTTASGAPGACTGGAAAGGGGYPHGCIDGLTAWDGPSMGIGMDACGSGGEAGKKY